MQTPMLILMHPVVNCPDRESDVDGLRLGSAAETWENSAGQHQTASMMPITACLPAHTARQQQT